MAVVLPILLLLGIGCVDIGRAIALHAGVANAVRVGADWAATHRFTDFTRASWESQIRQEVLTEMHAVPAFHDAGFEVAVETTAEGNGATHVRVSAAQDYTPLISWPLLPHQFWIERSLTVRQYQ